MKNSSRLLYKFAQQPVVIFISLILISALILFLRRPDALLTPQFWGEDGKFWYADAYNSGPITSIFMPYAGSLQVAMRLVASFSLLGPFGLAPLFFTLVALVLKVLPVLLLFTKRFSKLIPSVKIRLIVILFYLLIPSGYEIHANLTNINWHLTLLAFMVIIVKKSSSRLWGIFDFVALVLCGLTGPFSIILSFIALLNYRYAKNKRNLWILGILAACALIQTLVLLFGPDGARLNQPLEPSFTLLLKIIGSRVGTSTILGSTQTGIVIDPESWFNILIGLFVIGVNVWAFIKAKVFMRLFILLTWLMLAAAMLKPQASDALPQWYALLVGAGARYFFFPILCFFICLVFLAVSKTIPMVARALASLLVITSFAIALPADFRYEARPNLSFGYFEKEFRNIPQGQRFCLPINPGWTMCLDKH